jgi:threonine dehydrogenase-like Zn-dependent dehydrogenase
LKAPSNSNRGVVYLKPGTVEVQKIDFPTFRNPAGKTIDHGVILKVVTTNICGSDQHMVRGRTTAPAGMVLGHETTGEVIEKGRDVMQAVLWDRLPTAKIVNVKVISLGQAPEGYKNFDAGVAGKFVIDPHGQLPEAT